MPKSEQEPQRGTTEDRFSLAPGEFHPATSDAMRLVYTYMQNDPENWAMTVGALNSVAIEGNRLAEICLGTIQRLEDSQPVGERYILGLLLTLIRLEGRAFDLTSVVSTLRSLDALQTEYS